LPWGIEDSQYGGTAMNKRLLTCLLIGGLVPLIGCTIGHDGNVLSMKGYELYSWPAGQDWDFALMIGTNRLKTLEEITSPEQTLHGVEAIKAALRELPANEQVFWEGQGWLQQSQMASGSIAIPPAQIRDEIMGLCSQLGIRLSVDE
jgi:hypothetical protein